MGHTVSALAKLPVFLNVFTKNIQTQTTSSPADKCQIRGEYCTLRSKHQTGHVNTRNHGEHFEDWRQSRYDLCQPGEGGKSSGGNYSTWPPPEIPLWCGNIQHNCLKQRLMVMIY